MELRKRDELPNKSNWPEHVYSLRDAKRWPDRGVITYMEPGPIEWVRIGGQQILIPDRGKKIQLGRLGVTGVVDASTVFVGIDAIAWSWAVSERSAQDRIREIKALFTPGNPILYEPDQRRRLQPVMPAELSVKLFEMFVLPRKARRNRDPGIGLAYKQWYECMQLEIEEKGLFPFEEVRDNGRRLFPDRPSRRSKKRRPRASVEQ